MDMAARMESKIRERFQIIELEIVNESHLHKGHAGDNGTGQSHFRAKIVSSDFIGMSRLERQRLVVSHLHNEIQEIHAISFDIRDR